MEFNIALWVTKKKSQMQWRDKYPQKYPYDESKLDSIRSL